MIDNDVSNAGAIIIVESIDTAKKLAEQLGEYTTFMSGPAIDEEYYRPNKAAYVMGNHLHLKNVKRN